MQLYARAQARAAGAGLHVRDVNKTLNDKTKMF